MAVKSNPATLSRVQDSSLFFKALLRVSEVTSELPFSKQVICYGLLTLPE